MTWQARHDWIDGAKLPTGVRLGTCFHCHTLRVTPDPEAGEGVTFIRRKAAEDERVIAVEPPCIPPPSFFAAPW